MGADVGAFVTLDTVLGQPFGNESCDAAFFISGRTLLPCTVGNSFEIRNFKKVSVLGIDRTDKLVDKLRIVVDGSGLVFELSPCRINGKLDRKSVV